MASIDISPSDRQYIDYLADLFAIVVAIEQIEKASRRDLITSDEYTTTVRRLLDRYKSMVSALEDSRNPYFSTIDDFFYTYCSRCPAALTTIRKGVVSTDAENSARFLAPQALECGQLIVTLIDSLGLEGITMEQLNPNLTSLLHGMEKLGVKDKDFYKSLLKWKVKLDGMHATDELDRRSAPQFSYELQDAYEKLRKYLHGDTSNLVTR